MLGWSGSSCVMCGHSYADLVSETFESTPTLQLTLQKLWREVPANHNKFDVNRVFKESSRHGGSLFCLACLAALHGGMSVVSQVISLEQRLKNFAGCVGRKLSYLEGTVGHGSGHQKTEDDIVKETVSQLDVFPVFKCPEDPIDYERTEKCLTTDTDIKESSQEPRSKLRKLSKGRVVTSSRKEVPRPSRAPPVSPSTTKSDSPLPSLTARIPELENCPECDFVVDDRITTQTKSSTQPHKTLKAWKRSTRYKLAIHYRDNHMPPESQPNFQQTNDGCKLFLCPQCPYKTVKPGEAAMHYFRIHVLENQAAPSKLSCPTQGCSYSVDVPVRRGIFTFLPQQRHVKDALSVHVLTEHDIPSSAIHTAANSVRKQRTTRNNITPLFIRNSSNQREYHCTRCPHTTRLPENPKETQYVEYRRDFLIHFYDSHLSLSD